MNRSGKRQPETGEPGNDRRNERLARLKRGASGEFLAALMLLTRGYRILARRHRTPYGEVDIIAVRFGRLPFVEVKRRPTFEAAEAALSTHQAHRIADAAEYWIAKHQRYRNHEIGLDAVLVVPRRWPRHLQNVMADI